MLDVRHACAQGRLQCLLRKCERCLLGNQYRSLVSVILAKHNTTPMPNTSQAMIVIILTSFDASGCSVITLRIFIDFVLEFIPITLLSKDVKVYLVLIYHKVVTLFKYFSHFNQNLDKHLVLISASTIF